MDAGPVARAISARRSVRQFALSAVDTTIVRDLVSLACTAPAPHHSRPWRFVHVTTAGARERLADAMTDAWRADLEREGRPLREVSRRLLRAQRQVTSAPALLLACLCLDESRTWPDERHRLAERDMFVQSLGAALQNLLLAAVERGLTGYLKGAPLFCQQASRDALDLPADWEPAFLVLLGHPAPGYSAPPRDPADLDTFFVER